MQKSDLERVFNRPFREAKENWKSTCPFHDDNTPSFFVHKEEYVSHCFGCGVSGPIDRLASQYLSKSIDVARHELRIDPRERLTRKLGSRKAPRKRELYFPESWLRPFTQGAHSYILNRGFTASSLQGVNAVWDGSLKRQVFPHYKRDGRLLGAIGRACVGQDPKWYFYWGYDKGAALYTPRGITSSEPLVVVEGVFDLLWLYQHECKNVAAILGSHATRAQIRELARHSGGIIFALDNDIAGDSGTVHLQKKLKHSNCSRVVWPSKVNDWMDLNGKQIQQVLDGSLNKVQYSLRR